MDKSKQADTSSKSDPPKKVVYIPAGAESEDEDQIALQEETFLAIYKKYGTMNIQVVGPKEIIKYYPPSKKEN